MKTADECLCDSIQGSRLHWHDIPATRLVVASRQYPVILSGDSWILLFTQIAKMMENEAVGTRFVADPAMFVLF